MRSGSNTVNYFPENKLTKLANLVQFKRMLMFCLENWGVGPGPPCPHHCLTPSNNERKGRMCNVQQLAAVRSWSVPEDAGVDENSDKSHDDTCPWWSPCRRLHGCPHQQPCHSGGEHSDTRLACVNKPHAGIPDRPNHEQHRSVNDNAIKTLMLHSAYICNSKTQKHFLLNYAQNSIR